MLESASLHFEGTKMFCLALPLYLSACASKGIFLKKQIMQTSAMRQNITQDYKQVALTFWLFYLVF